MRCTKLTVPSVAHVLKIERLYPFVIRLSTERRTPKGSEALANFGSMFRTARVIMWTECMSKVEGTDTMG